MKRLTNPSGGAMPPKLDDETKRVNLVVPQSWVRMVNEWRRKQPDVPNLSQAIRKLVEAGIEAVGRQGKEGG